MSGRGQFVCGAKGCEEKRGLSSFEVNFAYQEAGESKQALVKLRVCPKHAEQVCRVFLLEKAASRVICTWKMYSFQASRIRAKHHLLLLDLMSQRSALYRNITVSSPDWLQ